MEAKPRNVETYIAQDGTCPFDEWMDGLRDRKGRVQIEVRLNRLRRGIVGDYGPVGDGIIELRIDFGPGYRIYCVDDGSNVLILWAGTKRTQQPDIERAKLYKREYDG